ncbi:MAG: LTA synthase family protein, partial [Bacilli bacterium]
IISVFLFATLCSGVLTYTFESNNVLENSAIESRVAFQNNGFVYSVVNDLLNRKETMIPRYSEAYMQSIGERFYAEEHAVIMKPNIILIQWESFINLEKINGIKVSETPTPFFNSLTERFSSGAFQLPKDTSTARTEFEMLTSLSLEHLDIPSAPHFELRDKGYIPSITHTLASRGYATSAVHNYQRTFYERDQFYPKLGFSDFIAGEDMPNYEMDEEDIGGDDSILIEVINKQLDKTETQDFIFAVTVETHGPYDENKKQYEERITVQAKTSQQSKLLSNYATRLKSVDRTLETFITTMEERNEPTVVLIYSDHFPPISFVNVETPSKERSILPYVMWDNIGLEKQDRHMKVREFMPYILERVQVPGNLIHNVYQNADKHEIDSLVQAIGFDMINGNQYLETAFQ